MVTPFPSELLESWFEGEAGALLAALIRHDLVRDATEATFVALERRVIRLTVTAVCAPPCA
jgi:hypothetical protein